MIRPLALIAPLLCATALAVPDNTVPVERADVNGRPAFPGLATQNLANQAVVLPGHFAGSEAWLVVVATDRELIDDIGAWGEVVEGWADNGTDVEFLCVPATPRLPGFLREQAWEELREQIEDPRSRARLAPAFTHVDDLCADLGMTDRSQVHAFVVDSAGAIHWHGVGAPGRGNLVAEARAALDSL